MTGFVTEETHLSEDTPLNIRNASVTSQPFRPMARVLQLLGDELIGNARLAVFELVKNAYDADASEVVVSLDFDSGSEPVITVSDDGAGMTPEELHSVWLVPGNDHRKKQRLADRRTPRHGRLPLGEKGLGRFAVHKLGNRITLVTRAAGSDECVVDIDWNELIEQTFLDQAPVSITVRHPQTFLGDGAGTQIEVRQLRDAWSRREVRRLQNQITSICSPFEGRDGFRATLRVPGRENWIEDLPDVSEILNRAIWKFSFRLDGEGFDWNYTFRQVPGLNLEGRSLSRTRDQLKLPSGSDDNRKGRMVVADQTVLEDIGPISGEFYVYDREREIRRRMPDLRLVETYLDETGGVRVYRDGIRVYNYAELGDDWLGLDLRRVNAPSRRISRNIILGAIHVSLQDSVGLIEKTNREGFVENEACGQLRRIVLGALSTLETERQIDKERIRRLTRKPSDPTSVRIEQPIQELKDELERQGELERFKRYVNSIEEDYRSMQETLLSAGMSGLNLAVVFHEVEYGVRALHRAIVEGADMESVARQARDLMHLLDGFATLLRRDSKQRHSGRKLINAVHQFNLLRLRHHRVQFSCPLLETDEEGFHSHFSFGLVVGALNNLLDNALYWLRVRWPGTPEQEQPADRKLFLNVSLDFDAGPAIVVADNGTGFQGDEPHRVVRPFFTRKPDGMGLGLYYTNLTMELNGGQLAFPQPGEVQIPEELDGAIVALIFKRAE